MRLPARCKSLKHKEQDRKDPVCRHCPGAGAMNIIFFSRREGRARHFNLAHPFAVAAFATVLVAILATAFSLGSQDRREQDAVRAASPPGRATLAEQQSEIKELKAELQRRVDAVAMRIGQMNAHVIRLDALGKRLTQMANIDNREFDFESQPAVGGPESDIGAAMQAPDLNSLLNGLEQKISSRDAQLGGARKRAALEEARRADPSRRPPGAGRPHLLVFRRAPGSVQRPPGVPQGHRFREPAGFGRRRRRRRRRHVLRARRPATATSSRSAMATA